VAVTANALGGDEERFLALGFDDYLSKPFRQSQLLGMMTKRLPSAEFPAETGNSSSGGTPASAAAAPRGDPGVLDAQALQRLRELDPTGENQLMERVLKAFDSSVARLVPQLIESQQGGDLTGVRHVAHTLKSSSASIGAIKLSQLCAEIEYMIRQGTSTDLDARIDAMRAEIELVLDSLRALLEAR
jgi:HPt (histidine-containing phosphotransfer) domain-containing protein